MLLAAKTIIELTADLPGGGTEKIKFTFPGVTDTSFQRGKKKHLDSRTATKGRRPIARWAEARIEFFDKFCERVDTLEERDAEGTVRNIMDGKDWLSKIDVNWKAGIVGEHFEEKESMTAEDEEDLSPASDAD